MNVQLVVKGTLTPEGILELDEDLPLPAGRVQVSVQPLVQPPPNDPFWTMMQRTWADLKSREAVPSTFAKVEAERKAVREESEAEIPAIVYVNDNGAPSGSTRKEEPRANKGRKEEVDPEVGTVSEGSGFGIGESPTAGDYPFDADIRKVETQGHGYGFGLPPTPSQEGEA